MNTYLAQQLHQVLTDQPGRTEALACAPSLRAAAATLGHCPAPTITATRVVGVVGRDDLDDLHALVTELAEQHGLDAAVRVRIGSFTVRFCRRTHAMSANSGSRG